MLNIAKDFSPYPAGRVATDGPYSGQRFRGELLEPAMKEGKELMIELDGTRGYGSSFLEEAFGGLVRAGYPSKTILSLLTFKTNDDSLTLEIKEYIENA
ncbi:MAG: STAS-like domain-containing protein [Gammaproteobacteria bacterium]|nr:STAS-like domain-containing protein [Gammaproteobacteria bacterium]